MGYDTLMNIGGEISLAEGEVTVDMTPAVHSSSVQNPNAGPQEPDLAYGGNPCGFVLKIKNGPVIYDSGDTAYFRDMELIGKFSPDVALLNIGGHFGMEPKDAALAARAVRTKLAIPQHYATFPVITQTPTTFVKFLKQLGIPSLVMAPGQTLRFKGNLPVK
jgi:L-ascorbate metabolism protein UlaG (beta-lactamase superfamily)